MRKNGFQNELEQRRTETQLEVGYFPSIFIGDSKHKPTYGHIVNYGLIKCPQFAKLGEGKEVFLFESEGLKFAIQGANIFYLSRMINLRLVAEIYIDENIEFNGHDIAIEEILIESMGDDSSE